LISPTTSGAHIDQNSALRLAFRGKLRNVYITAPAKCIDEFWRPKAIETNVLWPLGLLVSETRRDRLGAARPSTPGNGLDIKAGVQKPI